MNTPPSPSPLFARTCRDVTRLVLQSEDRRLRLLERWAVRAHMLICKACPRVVSQLALMRGAMGQWSAYAEPDQTSAPGDAKVTPPGLPKAE